MKVKVIYRNKKLSRSLPQYVTLPEGMGWLEWDKVVEYIAQHIGASSVIIKDYAPV